MEDRRLVCQFQTRETRVTTAAWITTALLWSRASLPVARERHHADALVLGLAAAEDTGSEHHGVSRVRKNSNVEH